MNHAESTRRHREPGKSRILMRRRCAADSLFRALAASRNRGFRPSACFAAGAVLAFYPGRNLASAFFIAAATLASAALVLRSARLRSLRLRALSILYFSSGLVFGAGFGIDDSALTAASAAIAGERARDLRGGLAIRALEGMPGSDAVPTRTGGFSFPLLVSTIEYSGKSAWGRVDFRTSRIPLRIVVQGSPGIETDRMLRVSGSPRPGLSDPGGQPENKTAVKSGPVLFACTGDVGLLRTPGFPARLRSFFRKTCAQALAKTGGESAGFLQALLLGIKDDLDSRESEAFRNAGCSHILALSGQHLSILASLVVTCLSAPLGKRRAGIASILFAIVFVWIAGPGPSLLRSLLMVLISAAARTLDRTADGLSVLSLCFIIALPLDPSAARSLSFVLSYLAILGLVLLTAPFDYIFGKTLPPFLSAALAAGCAAQVATAPVLVATFGILVPAGLVASVLSGPLVLALTWLALASAVLVALVPAAIPLAGIIVDIPYRLLMAIMETASHCPYMELPDTAARACMCVVVALLGLIVYARPYVDSRIRFPCLAQALPRNRGIGDVQKAGAEFPDQPPSA